MASPSGSRTSSHGVPPGWPAAVRPAGSPEWERSAVAWLLDQCPPEYRGYPVIVRHPLVLVRLAAHHLRAAGLANRQALAGIRVELTDDLTPPAMVDLIEALQSEQARLLAAARAVVLLENALRGRRYIPRL